MICRGYFSPGAVQNDRNISDGIEKIFLNCKIADYHIWTKMRKCRPQIAAFENLMQNCGYAVAENIYFCALP